MNDITLINVGNENFLDEEKQKVNYNKLEMLGDTITNVLQFQSNSYKIAPDSKKLNFFKFIQPLTEEALYQISYQLKPMKGSNESEQSPQRPPTEPSLNFSTIISREPKIRKSLKTLALPESSEAYNKFLKQLNPKKYIDILSELSSYQNRRTRAEYVFSKKGKKPKNYTWPKNRKTKLHAKVNQDSFQPNAKNDRKALNKTMKIRGKRNTFFTFHYFLKFGNFQFQIRREFSRRGVEQ